MGRSGLSCLYSLTTNTDVLYFFIIEQKAWYFLRSTHTTVGPTQRSFLYVSFLPKVYLSLFVIISDIFILTLHQIKHSQITLNNSRVSFVRVHTNHCEQTILLSSFNLQDPDYARKKNEEKNKVAVSNEG